MVIGLRPRQVLFLGRGQRKDIHASYKFIGGKLKNTKWEAIILY